MFNYRIYAKFQDTKKFLPIGGSGTVSKLIYAEHWRTLEEAEKVLADCMKHNPNVEFKIYDVKAKKYVKSEDNFIPPYPNNHLTYT